LLACAYCYYQKYSNEISYVTSEIDGNQYLVQNLPDKQDAANLLSMLRQRMSNFVESFKNANPKNSQVALLSSRFNPDNLTESTQNSEFTSYSVNKGEKIVFCIRQRDQNGELIDLNTVTFVALHELAHLMTRSIGHTDEFWTNFRFILKHAIDNGFYEYQPFHHSPVKYCGTMITDTPLKI
ncbi:MAG: hypothetical protein EBX50_19750, partial [Chitinophagia bacterium]|nr:hypothetical protein [Chitinophagia bacterium]